MIQSQITVVTVCYNAVKDIEKTILSVINQTYPNIEYIIIDGGSKDGTMDVVNRYKDKIDVIVSEPDKGIYDAMNKGIDRATGEWINFMNVGDCFVDNCVVTNMFQGGVKDSCGVLYGNSREYRGDTLYSVMPTPFFEQKKKHTSKGICHQSMFIRTALAQKYRYNVNFRIAADFDMAYRIHTQEKAAFEYRNVDVALYDITGFSNQRVAEAYYEEACITCPQESHNRALLMLKGKMICYAKTMIISILGLFTPPCCAGLEVATR